MDEDRVIQEFLGERPRGQQLREWITALRQRLAGLREEARRARSRGGPGGEAAAASLERKTADLRRQIQALEEEAAVTDFVEDSVRVTLAMGAMSETGREEA